MKNKHSTSGVVLLAVGFLWLAGCFAVGCTDSGSKEEPFPFPGDGTSAGGEASIDACVRDEDCPTNAPVCHPAEGCVQCASDDHCEAEFRCVDFECDPIPRCESGTDCSDPNFSLCDAETSGCVQCLTHSDCGASARCNVGHLCEPASPCETTAQCETGTVCDRKQGYCVDCLSDGDCGSGRVCSDNACILACTKNEHCEGNLALCDTARGHCVQCLGSEDCDENQFCSGGLCQSDTCTPGESTCSEELNAVISCPADGSSKTSLLCATGTTCQQGEERASCRTWTCAPGSVGCDGDSNKLTTCDESGLNFSSVVDCTESGGRCENAACVDTVCEAGENFCKNGSSYLCNGLGTAFTLAQSCAYSYHCEEESGLCVIDVCSENQKSCDGNTLRTCNGTGSGYLDADVDCGEAGAVCISGACKPVICDFETRCNGNSIENCTSAGTVIGTSTCSASRHCKVQDGTATCANDVCSEGNTTCFNGKFGTCNSDGSAWIDYEECTGNKLDCTVATGCIAQVAADFGLTLYAKDENFFLNGYLATADETLVSFDQYLRPNSTLAEITYAVYEADSKTGSYTLVATQAVLAGSTSTGWYKSPNLNVSLTADKYYLIGAHVTDVYYAYYSSGFFSNTTGSLTPQGFHYFYDPAPFQDPYSPSLTASYQFSQRLYFQ